MRSSFEDGNHTGNGRAVSKKKQKSAIDGSNGSVSKRTMLDMRRVINAGLAMEQDMPKTARIITIYLLIALGLIVMVPSAKAQMISSSSPPPPSFEHELMLIVIGAVLGGFLGPLLQIIDSWIGISPGVRQQKANYAVQRKIEAHLALLVKQSIQNTAPSEQGSTHLTVHKEEARNDQVTNRIAE